MKTKWIEKKINYDGSQLKPLYNYLEQGVLGNSIIAFCGSCDVSNQHMIDGEDLLQNAKIQSDQMVHFIAEIFDQNLYFAVAFQRLMASIGIDTLKELSGDSSLLALSRAGDDIWLGDRKLSISIATKSANSVLIHFAVNVSQKGTPVKTHSLEDFKIEPSLFAAEFLKKVSEEFINLVEATQKVRTF